MTANDVLSSATYRGSGRIQPKVAGSTIPRLSVDLKPNKAEPVVACVASFPRREKVLELCLATIIAQVDHCFVYLNSYDSVPDYLRHRKITIMRSQDFEDLSANGKVFFLDSIHSGYVLTLDDDFVYPSNYVRRMCETCAKYGNKCVVTVHGSVFANPLNWYYERFSMHLAQGELSTDRIITLPGSGTICFHAPTFKATFEDFYPRTMVDLTFAILAKQMEFPVISIARPSRWIQNTDREGLYSQFKSTLTHHTDYTIKFGPWGFHDMAPYVMRRFAECFGELTLDVIRARRLDRAFIRAAVSCDALPPDWKPSVLYYQKRAEFALLQVRG